MTTLAVEKRELTGKGVDSLREKGGIPAVMYGFNTESSNITVNAKEFDKIWKEAGESSMITLKTPDGEKDSLIQDVDTHPVTGEIRHVDFYIVDASKPVEVEIPLEFIGVSPAVKNLGGILIKVLHELEISVLPKNIPHQIDVNIEGLTDLDSHIKAGDLKLPEGATLITSPDEIVASISVAKEEEESAPLDLESIEVEKKGKTEEAPTE